MMRGRTSLGAAAAQSGPAFGAVLSSAGSQSIRRDRFSQTLATTSPKRSKPSSRGGAFLPLHPTLRRAGSLTTAGSARFSLKHIQELSFRPHQRSDGRQHDHGKAGQEYVNV